MPRRSVCQGAIVFNLKGTKSLTHSHTRTVLRWKQVYASSKYSQHTDFDLATDKANEGLHFSNRAERVEVDERTLANDFLPAFLRRVIAGRPSTLVGSTADGVC